MYALQWPSQLGVGTYYLEFAPDSHMLLIYHANFSDYGFMHTSLISASPVKKDVHPHMRCISLPRHAAQPCTPTS